MDKFLTRISVIFIASYFLVSYALAQFAGIDILSYSYILLLEACVVAYTFGSGKYHCRFMRWTALSILVCDSLSHIDYYFDVFTIHAHNLIPIAIMALGVATSSTLAVHHFYKVYKIRKKHNEYRKNISN